MRVRIWILVALLVFIAVPSQAQTPTPTSLAKRFLKLVPRLLGDHLSPPHPRPATETTQNCSGKKCL